MRPLDDENGLSFDYIFDPDLEVDDIELAFLSMEIASKLKNTLKNHPEYESILIHNSDLNKREIINKISSEISSDYNNHFQDLVSSIGILDPSGINLLHSVIEKTFDRMFESGLQENESGIGGWTLSKSIMSSFIYYSRRVRGSSKTTALKKQLEDWKFDLKKEEKVKNSIKKTDVNSNAKNKRLGYWDRRIMFKHQKIKEKEMELDRERKRSHKKSILSLKEELKEKQ